MSRLVELIDELVLDFKFELAGHGDVNREEYKDVLRETVARLKEIRKVAIRERDAGAGPAGSRAVRLVEERKGPGCRGACKAGCGREEGGNQ